MKSKMGGSTAQALVPPVLWQAARWSRDKLQDVAHGPKSEHDALFDGDRALFVDVMAGCWAYAEYGMGVSTRWVAKHTEAVISSVDTAGAWVDQTREAVPDLRHTLTHVDLGPVRNWGWPVGYHLRDRFTDYMDAPWNVRDDYDVVLVDGRFRVACFATVLLRARPGTRLVFDDYGNRPKYHLVEDYLEPVKRTKRQALFVVPDTVDRAALEELRAQFAMVKE